MQSVEEGGGRVERGHFKAGVEQTGEQTGGPGEGLGLVSGTLGQIQTPLPKSSVLHWTAQICIRNFTTTYLSSLIGVAGVQ